MKAILAVILLVLALIVLDIISGCVAAIINKDFQSSVMRTGLWHKFLEILCLVFGLALQTGQYFLELYGVNIAFPVGSAVFYLIGGYIIVMECRSFYENIKKAYPEFASDELGSILGQNDKEE